MAEDVFKKIFHLSSPPKSGSILSRTPVHTAGVSANLDETFEQFRKKYIDTEKPKGWFSSDYINYIIGFFLLALFGFFFFSYWPEASSSDSDSGSDIDPDDKGEGPSNKGKGKAVEPQDKESSSYLSKIGKFLPSLPIAWPSLPTFDLAQYIKDYLFSSTPKKPTISDAEFNRGLVDMVNANQEMEAVFDADKEDITVTDARTRAPSPEALDQAEEARKAFSSKDVPTMTKKEEAQIRAEYDVYFWPDEAAQQRATQEAESAAAALAIEEARAEAEAQAKADAKASALAKAAAVASTELEEADEDLEDEDEESEDEESDEEGSEGEGSGSGSDTETGSVNSDSTIRDNKQKVLAQILQIKRTNSN